MAVDFSKCMSGALRSGSMQQKWILQLLNSLERSIAAQLGFSRHAPDESRGILYLAVKSKNPQVYVLDDFHLEGDSFDATYVLYVEHNGTTYKVTGGKANDSVKNFVATRVSRQAFAAYRAPQTNRSAANNQIQATIVQSGGDNQQQQNPYMYHDQTNGNTNQYEMT